MDDLDCFEKTLDRIDSDLDAMTLRANAWATGDIDALRSLPDTNQREACLAALTGTNFARERGVTDLRRAHREYVARRGIGGACEERGDVRADADHGTARQGQLPREAQGEGLYGRGAGRVVERRR